jgi:hypothetical protein
VGRSNIIAVLFSVGMLSCAAEMSPQQECQELVGMICGRAVTCIANAADRRDACFDALERMAGCERVEQHSAMYETCLDRVESATCSELFSDSTNSNIKVLLPAGCEDVVDLMPGAGSSRMQVAPARELSE